MMLNEVVLIIFYIAILLYSVIIHEISHGIAALWLGDSTAKYAGRLTFNPIRHIDPWWTIAIPLLMLLVTQGRFTFGSAKPVPYNPYNLKNQRWGPAVVAVAGPGSNILLALIFALAARFIAIPAAAKIDIVQNITNWGNISQAISGSVGSIFFTLFAMIIFWNVLLAFFNLIPIPPLDGSKLLFSVLSVKTETMIILEQFGFMFLLLLIFLFSGPLSILLDFFWNLFFSIAI
ncbi:MAG: site-2 protease family protein [Candidatus Moranbacteria bacterium]|nr:site-2 protease family protein [Candidatus Moranbacteria bacterium]